MLESNLKRARDVTKNKGEGAGSASKLSELVFGSIGDVARLCVEEDNFRDWYRKCAGMHTVQKWCENYHKHPYGWGAMIMIMGSEPVCDRLRIKVENYAVYSALFLSASVPMMTAPDVYTAIQELNEEAGYEFLVMVKKRLFLYSCAMSIACHVTAIFLAMAFTNALNETARDSDVIRLFSEGKVGSLFFSWSGQHYTASCSLFVNREQWSWDVAQVPFLINYEEKIEHHDHTPSL